MRCWSPLASTRCEPDRLLSIHPSRFSAASTRAAFAMCSTVEHGHVKAGRALTHQLHIPQTEDGAALSRHEDLHRADFSTLLPAGAVH
jgi:hypothetical protein